MQFQYRLYPRCQNVVRLCDFPAVFPFLFSTHFAPAHKVCFLKYEDKICADTRFLSSLTIFCRKITNNSSCLMFVCLCVFASIQHLFQIDTLIVEKKMRRRRAGDVRLSAFIGSLRLGLSGFHQKVPLVCLGRVGLEERRVRTLRHVWPARRFWGLAGVEGCGNVVHFRRTFLAARTQIFVRSHPRFGRFWSKKASDRAR
jgi:hypothetical protein